MTCDEFCNGDTELRDHLEECPGCATRFARQQELAAGLKTLGGHMRRVEAPAAVERRLLAAFRSRAELGRADRRGSWWLIGAWAAGLAATALLAMALMRPHAPQRSRQTARSRTQLAMVQPDAAQPEIESGDGEFLPLPNTEAVGPNDEVNLVRIEVPRSAMIPLGFDVPAERAAEPVEADVLLDGDGVARAVRFFNFDRAAKEVSW